MNNLTWNHPDTIPDVEIFTEKEFWIAVDCRGIINVYLAQYQNRPLGEEYDEYEDMPDDVLLDPDGEPFSSVGWVELTRNFDSEYDDYYIPLEFTDNYKLIGWAEYEPPSFTGLNNGEQNETN